MKYHTIYFDSDNQKVRWTQSSSGELGATYNYIGKSTRVEFDLLVELLWYKFEMTKYHWKISKKYSMNCDLFAIRLNII